MNKIFANSSSPATASQAVYLELINTLYRQSPPIFFGNFVVAGISLFLLWDEVPHLALAGWVSTVYLVTILRVIMVWRDLRASPHTEQSIRYRAWRYVFFAGLSGCLWGAMGAIFFAPDNTVITVFTCIVLAGMTGGSVASLSSFWPAYYAYALPTVLPFAFVSFAYGSHLFTVLGVFSLFLLAVNLAYSRTIQRTVRDAVALRFENVDLIRQLTAEKERAELANRSKSQFLAAASHDLRQPTHALGLYIATLRALAHAPQVERIAVADLAVRLEAALKDMSQLLNVLLDISKLDAGVIKVSNQIFALQPKLTALASQFAHAAAGKGLTLKIRPSSAWLDTDPVLLQNILSNLISNALRYTVHGKILLACRRRGTELEICVIDTGIGIATEQFEHIFREFYQVDNVARDRAQGLGLGLAIVQRTATLLGARLTLRSSLGRGSWFSLFLPCRADTTKSTTLAIAPIEASPQGSFIGDNRRSILVIDDDQQVLDSMCVLLRAWGYRVSPARSMELAVAIVTTEQQLPDLVLSDFRLAADITGIDAIEAVRRATGRMLPAIIITGDTSADGIHTATLSGISLLHKPLDPADMQTAIAAALQSAS